MQTRITARFLATRQGQEANRILRSCVHCGFCTATCPTYQLLGDERDGPRGRIYLIKQVLEGSQASRHTQQHLDRCLTCRACETTCPSGVEYAHLLDIGREQVEAQVRRPPGQALLRYLLGQTLPHPARMKTLLQVTRLLRPLLPGHLKPRIPLLKRAPAANSNTLTSKRKLILPGGCVQPLLAPEIDHMATRVLNRLGFELISAGGCCGAVNHHLSQTDKAHRLMRNNIDAWWPLIEAGAEAILSTASGCGVMLKDYGYLLQDDPDYAQKARKVSQLSRDLVEVLEQEDLSPLHIDGRPAISFHAPCTLQHGQKLQGRVETLLQGLGLKLAPVRDAHLCCGSAGTYSITQARLSRQLRSGKLEALLDNQPEIIITANIGCLHHLNETSPVPVRHWIELLAT